MKSSPLPILLVAGFLGSGKTTLMRRLILDARARGLKLAVIVNEFGAADVDSNILREADAELISGIAGGCACCSGQDDFHATLLEIASRPADERPDAVLVEASGLADPVLLLDVMTGAQLLPLLRQAMILTVVDSGRFLELLGALGPLLRRQAQLADIVVLNKVDLVDAAKLQAVRAKISEIGPRSTPVPTQQCEFELGPVWEKLLNDNHAATPRELTQESGAPHAHYHTVVCPLPHPIERAQLEATLNELGAGNPYGEIWRVKGFVRLRGEANLQLVQYTGGGSSPGRYIIAPFYLPFGSDEPETALVFIGAELDRQKLLATFMGSRFLSAF